MCLCKIYDEENLRALQTSPPATSPPIPSPPYLLVASIALSSPTILKLFPRPNLPLIKPAAGNQRIIPVSKHRFHVSWHTLHDDSRDRHEWSILFRDSEDAVLLCEEEGGSESLGLCAG
jgi:hypothetical protein